MNGRVNKHYSVTCTLVSLACPFSSNFRKHGIDESLVVARRCEQLALPNLHPAHLPAAQLLQLLRLLNQPDVIVWYILASLYRPQREPTVPLCRLHKPSAALPAGPTLDVLVWYASAHTCTESTAFAIHTAVFSVRSCSCISVCTTCLLTDGQLIETVLSAADPRLHFAVK